MALVQQETVVLLVDLVESVRLMREHEASTVRRWADFVRIATSDILPRNRGVLVKSLGDGLMARFEAVSDAVDAAAEMHRELAIQNNGIALQDQCTPVATDIAQKLGVPLVATADAHYLCSEDARAHDVLFCINTRQMHDARKNSGLSLGHSLAAIMSIRRDSKISR